MTPSIATKFQYVNSPLFIFPSYSLHVSAPTSHLQVRYTIRCFQGLFLLQRIRCTYTTWRIHVICIYRYFDPWSPIHVIKLSIKVVKTLLFTVKLVSYIKYKDVKMLKFKVSRRLYPLMMVWAVLQSFWPVSRSASCRQWRSFFSYTCYCFSSLLFGWYVVLCWRCNV
jgi:hypothetical protein